MCHKKYSIFIILILIITACNNNLDNKQVIQEDKIEIPYAKETLNPNKKSKQLKLEVEDFEYNDGKYNVEKKIITIKRKKILIPQISNLNNIKKEKEINSLIETRVRKRIKNFDLSKGDFFYFKHKTKFKSDNFLSFLFKYDYFAKGMPHPNVFSFSINIDLEKNKILKQRDIITINDNIIRLFMQKKFIGKNEISKSYYPIYLKDDTPEYIKNEIENADIYLSESGIGFIIGTIYAVGSYMILELPYALLEY